MPRGAVCWVSEIQLPVAWRNIEESLNGRLYVEEADNRPVAHLPNLDGVAFTYPLTAQTVQLEASAGPYRWDATSDGTYLPNLNGVVFTRASDSTAATLASVAGDATLYTASLSTPGGSSWTESWRASAPSAAGFTLTRLLSPDAPGTYSYSSGTYTQSPHSWAATVSPAGHYFLVSNGTSLGFDITVRALADGSPFTSGT